MLNTTNRQVKNIVYDFVDKNFYNYFSCHYNILFKSQFKLSIGVDRKGSYYIKCNSQFDCSAMQMAGKIIHEYIHCFQLDKRMDLYVSFANCGEERPSVACVEYAYSLLKDFNKTKFKDFVAKYENAFLRKCFLEGMAFYYEIKFLGKDYSQCEHIINEYINDFSANNQTRMIPYIVGFILFLIMDKNNIDWQKYVFEENLSVFDILLTKL